MREAPACQFTLGQVLSITTGKLLCDIGDVYKILNYMTGANLMTHQLPRACRACAPALIGQHPTLADLNASEVHDKTTALRWLARQAKRFGNTLLVEPLKATAYAVMDPMAEAEAMIGKDRVIIVVKADD